MYRVVLIDDEYIILEGLRRVVKWADYGCEVVGTAQDAASGMALIRETRPDILFTDIRMPGRDGLTMLAALRSEFPDMQVTVLTGYRDFAYAQEAIRLGVTRFLLKPSKMDELREALEAMTARLAVRFQQTAGRGEEKDDKSSGAGNFIVNQAIAYIREHYAEKISLQDVAERCYISQWHLSKQLNRYAGKSFYDVLNSVRIEAACALLADPSLKISEISERVGYADVAHFARTFKKLEGVSANEYRNRL